MTDAFKSLKRGLKKELKNFVLLDDDVSDVHHFVSTGATALNYAIANQRNGGLPLGRITEISGKPASGKSLMAVHLCVEAQKEGALCVYLDNEHSLNEDFAKRIGLDTSSENFLMPEPPESVEAVFEFLFGLTHQIDELKKEGNFPWKYVLVIWDSVAATPCKADIEAENPDPTSNVGLKPRVLSKNLSTFLRMASKKDIVLVCLNQLRTNIRAMPGQDPWITPGGNAIPFYSSVRIRLSSIGKLKNSLKDVVGVKTEAKIEKTRFGPPFRKVVFPIYFTHGIDDPESILQSLVDRKAISSASAGRNGTILWFADQKKEDAIKKIDFKKLYMTDETFKNKVLDVFETAMSVDLIDPRMEELETSDED